MRSTLLSLLCATLLLAGTTYAAGAPAALQGKSVIVTWSEARTQRAVGEPGMRSTTVTAELSAYVSTAGRVFTRMVRTAAGARRSRSGSREAAPGQSLTGGAGRTSFQGQQLIIDSRYESGARRITVTFNPGFTTCSASIIQGKESGRPIVSTSMISGRRLEVYSIQVMSPNCRIQDGNVFGP